MHFNLELSDVCMYICVFLCVCVRVEGRSAAGRVDGVQCTPPHTHTHPYIKRGTRRTLYT